MASADEQLPLTSGGPTGDIFEDRSITGEGNRVHVGANTSTARGALKIIGHHNRVDLGDAVTLDRSSVVITGDEASGFGLGRDNEVRIDAGVVLRNVAIVINGTGNRIHIGRSASIQQRSEILAKGRHCTVRIGDGCAFQSTYLAAAETGTTIDIGREGLFADTFVANTSDWHAVFERSTGRRTNPASDIVVGHRVWAGADVRLMRRTVVGDHCVLAAGTVIRGPVLDEKGEIASRALIGGNPARVIRPDIAWSRHLTDDSLTTESLMRLPAEVAAQEYLLRGHTYSEWARYDALDGHLDQAEHSWSRAAENYQAAIDRVPTYTYALSAKAFICIHRHELAARRLAGSSADHLLAAQDLFERAVSVDPQHADAWLGLGRTYLAAAVTGAPSTGLDRSDLLRRSHEALERALALDPMHAEAHVELARYRTVSTSS
jgi:acetyltransferase-like isoleucine patch superfamily enzyme